MRWVSGIDLATREGILDPAELTDDIEVKAAVVDDAGDLIGEWANDGQRSVSRGVVASRR